MSSDLKDARWQLASEIAEEDGKDLYKSSYTLRCAYLDIAKNRLDSAWGQENVDRLASEFRKGQ